MKQYKISRDELRDLLQQAFGAGLAGWGGSQNTSVVRILERFEHTRETAAWTIEDIEFDYPEVHTHLVDVLLDRQDYIEWVGPDPINTFYD